MARDLAASVLDEPPESIEVKVVYPDPVDALRRSVAEARPAPALLYVQPIDDNRHGDEARRGPRDPAR